MAFDGWEVVPERFARKGTSKTNLQLGQETLMHLGSIVAHFGYLEVLCGAVLELLIPCDHLVAQMLTWELSFKQKVAMLKNLFMDRFPGEADTYIDALTACLFQVEDKRNRMMHSLWFCRDGSPQDTATRYKVTAKAKGVSIQEEDLSAEALKAVVDDIASASFRVYVLFYNVGVRLQEQ